MIAVESMKSGLIIHDPRGVTPAEKRYYRLLLPKSPEGPWPARSVSGGLTTLFTVKDLERLQLTEDEVYCDVNLTAMLDKKVHLKLKWGQASGRVEEVRYHTAIVFGTSLKFPVEILIDATIYKLDELLELTLVE